MPALGGGGRPRHRAAGHAGIPGGSAGLRIRRAAEAHPQVTFTDIGAVVFQLRAVEWQIPGFTVAAYRHALRRLHERRPITVTGAWFLVEALRPS